MQSVFWSEVYQQKKALENVSIRDLFVKNPKRFEQFSLCVGNLLLDYSKQQIDKETLDKLIQLAESYKLSDSIQALFYGEKINQSEDRAVLHTALRDFSSNPIHQEGEDIKCDIKTVLQQMELFAEQIQKGEYRGATDLPFTDVICLGIGGSELGPRLVMEALATYQVNDLKFHFISNVFGSTLSNKCRQLNPETTLCIISSKTFTTPETLQNAKALKTWFEKKLPSENKLLCKENASKHLVAVTAAPQLALEFGILENNIFKFWPWVGGRFSIWSAVGLPVILSIGMRHFMSFLRGARSMDTHFYTADFSQNMPVILALLGIWNHTVLEMNTQAIIPYDDRLQHLPAYLQQLEMESNGKSMNIRGETITYNTAPIVWGGVGCNGQHAYMQLLHQGKTIIPVDFLISAKGDEDFPEHHQLLVASCFTQSKALMEGQVEVELQDSMDNTLLNKFKACPGNRPSSTLMYSDLTPETLGALIALYEHKVFVQGRIWEINSFDQWGVELGKTLARKILNEMSTLNEKVENEKAEFATEDMIETENDSSTAGLMKYYNYYNNK